MKLRHFIVILVLAGAAGILSAWQNVRVRAAGLRTNEAVDDIKEIEKEIKRLDVELEQLRNREYLKLKAQDNNLAIQPP
jgi:hypothetical protein